jgi:hypothetical protein
MGVADAIRFGRRPSTDTELQGAISQALEAARLLEAHLDEVNRDAAEAEAVS